MTAFEMRGSLQSGCFLKDRKDGSIATVVAVEVVVAMVVVVMVVMTLG